MMMFAPLKIFVFNTFVCFFFISCTNAGRPVLHDWDFVPDIILRVSVATIQLNCQPRLSTLVNGTYPGAPLYLEPERTTWIRVYNDADVNTTMHWHGLSLSTAPYADGSPQASQWPIPPGHFFDYELHPQAHEAGTSFYHSHVGFQASTAAGALIVKDAAPLPYPYDEEIILKLGDFYPHDDQTIEAQLTGSPMIWAGDPASLLVNGHSGTSPTTLNQSDMATPGTDPSDLDPSCHPWIMDVAPDTTYRVRLIGGTTISLVVMGFEEHDNLTIIETDNSYVYPVETEYMQIDSGQRFSFLLKTKSRKELDSLPQGKRSTFWIQFETRQNDRVVTAWALLRYNLTQTPEEYKGRKPKPYPPNPEPTTSVPSSSNPTTHPSNDTIPTSPLLSLPTDPATWLEYTFQNPPFAGYDPPPTASEVTRRVVISTLQFLNTTTNRTLMVSNNASWFDGPPLGPSTHTPYLVELLQQGTINGHVPDYERAQIQNSGDPANPTKRTSGNVGPGLDVLGLDAMSNTYPARIGEVIEIVWQNAASSPARVFGAHPMHAHGGPYWDMGSGSGVYDPETHAELLQQHSTNKLEGASAVASPSTGSTTRGPPTATPSSTGPPTGVSAPWPGSRRDTTMLYKYTSHGTSPGDVNGWRVWRIRVTERNVGVWMMHCHILLHMVMGQQTVWVFGTPEEVRNRTLPVQGSLSGYFTYGGDVVGKTQRFAGAGKDGGSSKGKDQGQGRDGPVNVVQFFD